MNCNLHLQSLALINLEIDVVIHADRQMGTTRSTWLLMLAKITDSVYG